MADNTPPKNIWLQCWDDEYFKQDYNPHGTWCEDEINDTDERYIHFDAIESGVKSVLGQLDVVAALDDSNREKIIKARDKLNDVIFNG